MSEKIWTTSGVSAKLNGVIAWLATLLSRELMRKILEIMEYNRVESAEDDPYAAVNDCKNIMPQE